MWLYRASSNANAVSGERKRKGIGNQVRDIKITVGDIFVRCCRDEYFLGKTVTHLILSSPINLHQLSSTSIDNYQLLSIIINFCLLSMTSINPYQLWPTFINDHQLSSTSINSCKLPWTLVNIRTFSSAPNYSHQLSEVQILIIWVISFFLFFFPFFLTANLHVAPGALWSSSLDLL